MNRCLDCGKDFTSYESIHPGLCYDCAGLRQRRFWSSIMLMRKRESWGIGGKQSEKVQDNE
jgi:hypothetical protein